MSALAGVERVVAHVEGAVSERLFAAVAVEAPARITLGQPVAVERGASAGELLGRVREGERTAVLALAGDLASARRELGHLSAKRAAVVVHAVVGGAAGLADALALGDLPLGMLIAASPIEAVDLTLVAHRVAEDSGCPCVVVHDWSGPVPELPALGAELCTRFLGAAKAEAPAASRSDRPLAETLPFALGSALRDLEGLVARRLDVVERAPAAEASLALVGLGAMGRALVDAVARVREAGHDVAALRLVAWRPLPAPRLVKALCRAHALTVVEALPRTTSAPPLASAVKAAFSDALTWAPGYPGIGRIPRVASALAAPGEALGATQVDAVVANLVAGDRGLRAFTLDGDRLAAHASD